MFSSLKRWLRPKDSANPARWVVLDVESTGLDVRNDRLLAIAAIAVHVADGRARIDLGDSFEVVLGHVAEPAAPDKANILLHGIGVGAQRAGMPPAAALAAFARYAGASPLIAFHAAFDRAMIERAIKAEQAPRLANPWMDLEPLAAVLYPKVRARALDEWMAEFRIHCAVRHQAAADTLATAELLLKLWPALCVQCPKPTFAAAAHLAAQRRWVQG
jgi:DNA polymerase-3 subunit epsilon